MTKGQDAGDGDARRRKWLVPSLAGTCAVAWLIAAVHPLDQGAWILENLLLVAFVIVLFFGHRRVQLSNISYCLLAAFVMLHIIGAHYTYAQMPVGLWARDYFGFSRNHYDRFAHGAFGFLLAFPVRELLLRFSGTNYRWSYWLAPAVILAVSGVFEIIESIVAEMIAPGTGVAWLGGQGDEWDAQSDMLAAGIGAFLMMALVAMSARRSREGMTACPAKFIDNRFVAILAGSYAVWWILLAIRPVDRGDWFLENLLVFAGLAVLIFTYSRFQFSNLTYVLITLFLALHAVGAHYTYAEVPAGFWIQDWLHLSRNHFDRAIHFAFGLLLLYPLRELLLRTAKVRATWASWLALAAMAALSSCFEIIEAIIAKIVHPDLGTAYLGTQGDIWDAQKDMVAAIVGGILAIVAISALKRGRD